jgi:hypothetical protein
MFSQHQTIYLMVELVGLVELVILRVEQGLQVLLVGFVGELVKLEGLLVGL